jgi:nucleoside diphosphate kinase
MGETLLDRVLCVAGAITLSQAPEFFQQYLQRLGGHLDEARRVLASFEAVARESRRGLYPRGFFGELVDFMTSGPVVLQVLEGENAVAHHREVMGATDPAKAADGTVRKLFAKSIGENSVHGSDSEASAEREINFFFRLDEIVG